MEAQNVAKTGTSEATDQELVEQSKQGDEEAMAHDSFLPFTEKHRFFVEECAFLDDFL